MSTEILGGSRTSFGPREVEKKAPAMVPSSRIKEMVVPINWDDMPGVSADDATVQELPAHAWIKTATLRVLEPFTSAGSAALDIGLAQSDGTVIDADGIDAAIALTAIDAIGETVVCNGALVRATGGIGANAAQVTTNVAVAAFTGGKGMLLIRYIDLAG